MTRIRARLSSLLLIAGWSLAAQAQLGTITGEVTDGNDQPLVGISVFALAANGSLHQITTNALGEYAFYELDPDHYLVWINPPQGMTYVQPAGGFYAIFVGTASTYFLPFKLRTTGVSMDFGKPPPSGGSTTSPVRVLPPNHFEIAFFLRNPTWPGITPDTMDLVGTWRVHLEPTTTVTITGITIQDPRGRSSASFANHSKNRFSIRVHDPGMTALTSAGYLLRVEATILSSTTAPQSEARALLIENGLSTFSNGRTVVDWCPVTGVFYLGH